MKCSECDGSGLVEENHGMGLFEYLGCQDCQGVGHLPGEPVTAAVCLSCDGIIFQEATTWWHSRFGCCVFPDPRPGTQRIYATAESYIRSSTTAEEVVVIPPPTPPAIFEQQRQGHQPPNTTTQEPDLVEAEIVHDAPQAGRCSTCQWWRRDVPGSLDSAARESIEWGVCLIASDPADEIPGLLLTEARQSAPFQASAGGWEVEETSLSTRSNFGCTEWKEGK